VNGPTSYARIRVADGSVLTADYSPDGTLNAAGRVYRAEEIQYLPPASPTKLVCVGLNYRAHADEMAESLPDEPLLFFKPPSALAAFGEPIVRPVGVTSRLDYEGELVVVMARRTTRVSEASALEYVEGLTIGNDVTARQFQVPGSQWTRAKGYDTFAPVGPAIVRTTDWSGRGVETRLNGGLVQSSTTDRMIFGVPTLISWISSIMTLEPGDLIFTGTPSGVGPMNDGDVVEVTVEGIGCLRNTVIASEVLFDKQPVGAPS